MKTAALLAGAALLTAGAAHAQVMTQTTEQVTTEVTTDVYPPNATVGAPVQPSFPGQAVTTTETTRTITEQVSVPHDGQLAGGSTVQVKIPSGQILTINDAPGAPWAKDPQLAGYDRFTFDPVANVLVAGKGEAKFDSNWDENGNRIVKPKPVVKKKKVVVKEEAPVEEAAPVEEPAAPAVEEPTATAPAAPAAEPVATTPTAEPTAATPAVEQPAKTAPATGAAH